METPKIKYEFRFHRGKDRIFLSFDFDEKLNNRVKRLKGVKWSRKFKAWYFEDTSENRQRFHLPAKIAANEIYPINKSALEKLIETLQLKGYSANTIRTYRNEFVQLLNALKSHNVNDLDATRIRSYFLYCVNELKLSENTIHSRLNAVKFYFEQVLHRDKIFIEIPRPKKPSKLPQVISVRDIKKLFRVTTNLKHNTMLKLCYGLGLRVSEIVNLKIADIDSGNMQVFIERAKGKKDRYVNLPESILEQLREYFRQYRPKKYLFEGQTGGQYSIRACQKVFTEAMRKAGINKAVGIHGLRHSFATHLLENGTDISFIQKLLGHKDIKTTLRYTHVSRDAIKNIKSPLDLMEEKE